MPFRVGRCIERRHGFFARHILQHNFLPIVVQVSAHSNQHAVIFHRHRSGLFAFSRRKVIAGIPASRYVHPRGINILSRRSRITRLLKRNRDLQIRLVIRRGRWVVHHRFDADLFAFLHAISIAGDFGPVRQFAARAKNVLFLIGAEKIRAILVPERHMMQYRSRHGVPGGVHKLRVIRQQPPIERHRPNQVRRLRHFHVRGVRRQIHRAHAQRNCMRGHVEIRIELDAFRHRVVHAFLHESVMLVLHRHRFRRAFGLFFLGESCAGGQQERSADGDYFDDCCDARFDYWFDHWTSPGLPSPGRGLLSSYSPPENGVMQWGVLPNEQQPCSNVEEEKNRDAWCRASGLSMK